MLHFVCKVLAGLCRAGLGSSLLSTSPSDLSARILLTHLEANYFASSPVSVANRSINSDINHSLRHFASAYTAGIIADEVLCHLLFSGTARL